MAKLKVGILGATGMVGQRFISLLENHPWFETVLVAASSRSAGHEYQETVEDRWAMASAIPDKVKKLVVKAAEDDISEITAHVDLVFSALDMDKSKIRQLEEKYAALESPVESNNSAHRWTPDVPMIMPEINPEHIELIDAQRKNRGWKKGLIAVKPNCSIQSYVPVLQALKKYRPLTVTLTILQAISGASKTFATWPEMVDNAIPYIAGEEEKSKTEPMKIWGNIVDGKIELATEPVISATCIRVPTQDGHMASVAVKFANTPSKQEFIQGLQNFANPLIKLELPSAPRQFIKLFVEDDRPQTRLDRDYQDGMGITVGRLRKDTALDWKFIALSHNTVRGAAGGAVLVAELLRSKGYIQS